MNLNSVDVLLVEDNINDAKLTIRELEKYNLASKLYHVRDGMEAFDFIFATGGYAGTRHSMYLPKIILLDIQMPKINGMEVLKKLKAEKLSQMIPIVILTASNESPDIRKCYDLGAASYIVKPLNIRGFIDAVERLGIYPQLLSRLVVNDE